MNFLVVNPWIYDSAAYDFWLKPLGLLYNAEILKLLGHHVVFLDLLNRYDTDLLKFKSPKDKKYGTGKFYTEVVEKPAILKNIPREFKRYGIPLKVAKNKIEVIKNEQKIDAVFIGVTLTYWYYGGLKTIELLREYFPTQPFFLGGIYSTIYPQHADETFSKYDVIVLPGTGLNPLIQALQILDLSKSSLNSFDWFEETDLTYDFYDSVLPYVVLITSIGCVFNCSYCVTPKMWQFQFRTIPAIINNIKYILSKRPDIKDIAFFDDAFLLRKDIHELLKSLSFFKVRYHLPNGIHARMVTPEISSLLKTANFKTIKLGYESHDFKIQKNTGFKVTNTDLVNAVNNLKSAGFTNEEISAYILLNLPEQDKEDVIEAIDFCYELGIGINLNEFTPIPGTQEFDYLVSNKFIDKDIDPLLLNNTYLPYWSNFGLSEGEIREIKQYARLKYQH
ncbi:MAG TPA: radical SAM protein [Defluviitoga sp.]|nr:radical SAM protein [Defluviitoga sp.]HOP23980.1 radical SAM protein [Defluviitoga sp.]HPZ28915.1 radical SAM protein [Defluviitoga sp.]HQD62301.1 radical SAM protein [Defluviitoga sp.]